jgi:hypothetical protein
MENSYRNCADCRIVENLRNCKKLNNFMSKLFSLVFRSDRFACIAFIKEKCYDEFAIEMAEKGIISIKR